MRAVMWAMNKFYTKVGNCVRNDKYICRMNYTVRIYCLYDSRNGNIFYVGASKNVPSMRLQHHLSGSISETRDKNTCQVRRSQHVKSILKNGGKIKAKILRYVTDLDCNYWEEYYYLKLIDKGHNLIQDDKLFYSQYSYKTTMQRKQSLNN